MNVKKYKAIDLFAGIGGMRLAFEKAGFEIVYSNDVNKHACVTYRANFGDIDERDVRQVDLNNVPEFDVLFGGFPCQPFSQIGKRDGLNDPRGQLFNEIIRFLDLRKPSAFVLENVKNLPKHNGGKTYEFIKKSLTDAGGGYTVYEKILDSKNFGIPQHRERIYIVGIRNPHRDFVIPERSRAQGKKSLGEILERKTDEKYYLSQKYYEGLLRHKNRHAAKGSGFGCEVLDPKGVSNTLVCGNMGRERNLIKDRPVSLNRWGIRRLTERECARLQGFPEKFKIPVSMTQAYIQFGNAVSVPVAHTIAKALVEYLDENKTLKKVGNRIDFKIPSLSI